MRILIPLTALLVITGCSKPAVEEVQTTAAGQRLVNVLKKASPKWSGS